jgi:hypothetical protein
MSDSTQHRGSHAKAVAAISAVLLSLALGASLASAAAPVVLVDPSATASYTSAEVSGEVDPEDRDVYYFFQYAADPATEGWSYGPQAFSRTLSAGAGLSSVSETLTGLKPGTEYEFRLVAVPTDFSEAETPSAEPNPTFTTEAVGPPSVSIDPVTAVTGTTAHFSGTIDPEAPAGNPSAFDVNWRFECTPSCPGLSGGTIPADSSSHVVEADATGLEPNTSYEVRLVAENAGEPVSAGPRSFETEQVAPAVQTLYAGEVSTESAVLAANINPRNSPVTYQFEWGPDESYGNVSPATPLTLGAEDNSFHVVIASIAGLSEATSYHYRVVATNSDTSQAVSGSDRVFTTASSTPPSQRQRAYEKVSPDDKNNNDVIAGSGRQAVSPSGDLANVPLVQTAPGSSAGGFSEFLAMRSSTGWMSQLLDPPVPSPSTNIAFLTPIQRGFTEDLRHSFVSSYSALTPDAEHHAPNLYMRDIHGQYTLLTPGASPVPVRDRDPIPGGSSSDARLVAFTGFQRLLDGAAPDRFRNAYEWDEGELRLAGILPDGSPAPFGSYLGSGPSGGRQTNVVSRDGHRVFFQTVEAAESVEAGPTAGQIYARDNHGTSTTADDTTIHVSASQRTDCADQQPCSGDPEPDPAGPLPATYWMAEAEHGSSVLFTSCERLTDDSTADATAEGTCNQTRATGVERPLGRDLYLYDVGSDQLLDLTTADPAGADVLGVVGVSDDLAWIYFVAQGVLDADGAAIRGEPNLYVWHGGETTFIATLEGDEAAGVLNDSANWSLQQGPDQVARVTSDGEQAVFVSRKQLTAYDNSSAACSRGRCAEVYSYDAISGELTCVSCGPGSSAPAGDSRLAMSTGGRERPLSRVIAEGGTVFFETPNALATADSNGKIDVYEWSGGNAHLISPGTGSSDSLLVDASADGSNVFFITRDRLLPRIDRDEAVDLYDARVGGGFPEPVPSPACEGDACLPPPIVPHDTTPASVTFSGAGNVRPKQARKAKRHRRKQRKQGKQRRRQKRHQANQNRRAGR